jgi:hypothetical protein
VKSAWRLLGLLIAPALTVLAAALLRRVTLGDGATEALTYGAGTATAITALVATARAQTPGRVAVAIAACGVALAGASFVLRGWPLAAAALVNLGLVAVGHALGASIGHRVAHPGHLLPACAVAAAADVASVVHPAGPSHAVAESEAALSLVAVRFPVAGTGSFAPVLGVGDLVFVALLLGVAVAHGISLIRVSLAVVTGVALAGVASALLAAAVPALVPIGVAVVALVPSARRVRVEDRRTTALAVALATAVAVGIGLRVLVAR